MADGGAAVDEPIKLFGACSSILTHRIGADALQPFMRESTATVLKLMDRHTRTVPLPSPPSPDGASQTAKLEPPGLCFSEIASKIRSAA